MVRIICKDISYNETSKRLIFVEWQYSNTIGHWTISDDINLIVDPVCSAECEI